MPDLFPFLPFPTSAAPQPLSRFLPLLPEGLISAWLFENLPTGSLVIDPFGSQPRLAIEAASQGYRVLVTCNNPIERFLLDLSVHPPSREELQAALADLSVSIRGKERTEAHIRSLYQTACASCGESIETQAFIWEHESEKIIERLYTCPFCGDSGSHPAVQTDRENAAQFKKSGLDWSRAIEWVTPKDDPDRLHAEEALETYTPRAVHALVSLVNTLDRMPTARLRAMQAMLLTAFEQANSLWSYSTQRERPRQLKTSPLFFEKNIWNALEECIDQLAGLPPAAQDLRLTSWPEPPPITGGICLFSGPLRQLADQWSPALQASFPIQGVLAAIPRPNQAYWTLSALWSGWLWGPEATAPFKSVLRRRRYDWQWHCGALFSVFQSLNRLLVAETPFWACVSECEHAFLAAALVAADLADFELDGLALREEVDQAQLRWLARGSPGWGASRQKLLTKKMLRSASQQAASEHLEARQEPASYGQLSAAVLAGLPRKWDIQIDSAESPVDRLAALQAAISQALADPAEFERLGASERSSETGSWWLSPGKPVDSNQAQLHGYSLSDRVEMGVVRFLIDHPGSSLDQIDQAICRDFDGLFTPGLDLLRAAVISYAQPVGETDSSWILREQDSPAARRADLQDVASQVMKIGEYLSLQVLQNEAGSFPQFVQPPVTWSDQEGRLIYRFYFFASATCSWLISSSNYLESAVFSPLVNSRKRTLIVIPGGRAGLMLFKMGTNPILKRSIQAGWRILKFRLIHRLADNLSFSLEQLETLFDLDPLAYQDPQIPLI